MEILNKEQNIRYGRIALGALCVFGMAFEILWVLSHLFDDGMSLSLSFFTWLSSNNYLGEIFISIVRMSILGVILTVKSVNDPVCVRTQDLLVVRLLRVVGVGFIAYSFIGDAMLDVEYTSINYARSEYFMNASYYLLLGIEVYLMILLLIKSREKFRTIFVLEVAATAVFIIALLLSGLFLNFDNIVMFYETIVYGVVAVLYLISYFIAITLLFTTDEASTLE